jgi:[ribosomal protein S5]-alanine N-acetyltransferase
MHFAVDFPALETARLRLRAFTADDAPRVQQLAGAREVADTTAVIPHPYPDGAAESWIAMHATAWREQRELVLASTLKDTGELIGAIGLVFDRTHELGELGYWVGVPYWGRGFATEAGRAVLGFAFREMGVHRVQAHHFARNPASGRVMLKMGMKLEGERPGAFKKNDRFEDLVLFGAVRPFWLAAQDI